MKRAFLTRAIAGVALVAVALGAVAFQTRPAGAQSPFVSAGGPYVGTAGVPVPMTAASNVGPVAGVFWQFGDGSSDRGFSVLKTYFAPGVYPVTVTVTNTLGQSFSATTMATIGGVPRVQFASGSTVAVTAPVALTAPVVVVPANCQVLDPRLDLRGVATVLVGQTLVTTTGQVVCAPGMVPGTTVVASPYCYAIWLQYGFIPAWVVGCR